MSSSVFFKFKSQKEPSRVTFDGTGISVFELKREIISINRLGDGTDFDLLIYNQDTNEEYDDDTTIIPRSTYVIARRLPATRPGRGTAARYVSGKMPAGPNMSRQEKHSFAPKHAPKEETSESSAVAKPITGDSEADEIQRMFQASSDAWSKTQEQMANATPVHRGGNFKRNNPVNVPSHPPPNGYVCFRCSEKGHWIQQCPTNSDPNYDGRPRVKRTTGIPRSFLKAVEKPIPAAPSQSGEGSTALAPAPASVMVNAEGEFVVAEPDKASWESYQQKANTSSAKAVQGNKELQEKGLECSHCHRLYKDAVRTPCCEKTFCEECIQQQLLDSDFVCPVCETKEVLLEKLVPDTTTRNKVEDYLKETKSKDEAGSNFNASTAQSQNATSGMQQKPSHPGPGSLPLNNANAMGNMNRKRPAEDIPNAPRGPAAMRNQHNQQTAQNQFRPQPPMPAPHMQPQMPFFPPYQAPFSMPPQSQPFFNGPMGQPFMPPFGGPGGPMPMFNPMAPPMQHMPPPYGFPHDQNFFPGQQQVFPDPFGAEEESAYMRRPVNPHRHRPIKRVRQADFKALGGES